MSATTDPASSPIDSVREGMQVIDSQGQDLGTVSLVRLSDPGVESSAGQESGIDPARQDDGTAVPPVVPAVVPGAAGVTGMGTGAAGGVGMGAQGAMVGAALGADGSPGDAEPDVPPSLAERLRRHGYLKIDSKGWFHRDLYVAADQISDADDNTVRLRSSKDDLIKQA